MPRLSKIRFEGYTANELLNLPPEEFDEFVFCGDPIVVNVGTSTVLGKFSKAEDRLVLELAQIDGGGEGILPALNSLSRAVAMSRQLGSVEWRVHALNCANPNLKLRRVLERRGFEIRDIEGTGLVYHQVVPVDAGGSAE